MFGRARLSIAPLPAFGEHDNPLTRGLPAGTLHPHSRLPASRGVNCTRQVTGHEAADHRLRSSSSEPSGLTSAKATPPRGGTGCRARWPTSGSASPTAPSSLVHIWPVEHRGFPVGLSRHEQEPGGGGGVGDRELLSGTQQDQLGSVCLSLRARFTQNSTLRHSESPRPSPRSSAPIASACHAPRPVRSASSAPFGSRARSMAPPGPVLWPVLAEPSRMYQRLSNPRSGCLVSIPDSSERRNRLSCTRMKGSDSS